MLPILSNRFEVFGPSSVLPTLRQEVDRLFDEVWSGDSTRRLIDWVPAVEVSETADEIRCTFEVPGVSPDDISITLDDNVLTIEGNKNKKIEHEERAGGRDAGGEYHLAERRYGRFTRSFTLPRQVDVERVGATYENGVLTVVLPKRADAKPRRVAIGGAGQATAMQVGKEANARERNAA